MNKLTNWSKSTKNEKWFQKKVLETKGRFLPPKKLKFDIFSFLENPKLLPISPKNIFSLTQKILPPTFFSCSSLGVMQKKSKNRLHSVKLIKTKKKKLKKVFKSCVVFYFDFCLIWNWSDLGSFFPNVTPNIMLSNMFFVTPYLISTTNHLLQGIVKTSKNEVKKSILIFWKIVFVFFLM